MMSGLSGEARDIFNEMEAFVNRLRDRGASDDALLLALSTLGTVALITSC
jgi:hypothetical protein